jgi:hypothetical protein
MGGGLMQLVAYGAQDIYLTGNPQITFFKVVYRRHTNFSMEAIQQTLNGTAAASGSQTCTISRNGDLVNRVYIEDVEPGSITFAVDNPGYNMFDNVELEIGGQLIDRHYGHWMNTWAQLTEPNDTGSAAEIAKLGDAVGAGADADDAYTHAGTRFQAMAVAGGVKAGVLGAYTNQIPLQFWFCRNPGLALPLIALQYHEVKIKLNFSAAYVTTSVLSLWCDYIYLDTDERRRFAQVSHEYLIEQVQHQNLSASTSSDLNFNHPIKELIWTGVPDTTTKTPAVLTGTFHLKLNGHERMAARNFSYFTRCQVWQHHTGYGSIITRDGIAVYSFALKPEEHQPSGTCNFSRIDNAQLVSSVATSATNHCYAINYNVLRIMSGMGGLAYSN